MESTVILSLLFEGGCGKIVENSNFVFGFRKFIFAPQTATSQS